MAHRKEIASSPVKHQRIMVSRLLGWFASNARDLPWRRTLDPYAIWVSEIMLQQTQVKTVVAYWKRWMRELPDVLALANAPPDNVLKLWEGLGYYARARNLQGAAAQIAARHGGQFPPHFDDVLALPGIGRYTAGAICSIAFNQPTPILDGNVIRVLARVFGIKGDPREKTVNSRLWQLAESLVTAAGDFHFSPVTSRSSPTVLFSGSCSALNQSLMELGALVCTPKAARCGQCPLCSRCIALSTDRVEKLPSVGKRTQSIARRFVAFAAEHRGRWLVRRRPAGVVNAQLWEWPNLEVNGVAIKAASLFARQIGGRPRSMEPLPIIKHSITRYRISIEAFRVLLAARPCRAETSARWLPAEKIEGLAFTSAHRKIWERIRPPQIQASRV